MAMKDSPHYARWKHMISRCEDPNHHKFPLYGARGISVCEEWHDLYKYAEALEALGPKPSEHHTIDRIDNDKNYEPGNIKWSSPSEQLRNRRPYKRNKAASKLVARSDIKTNVLVDGTPVALKYAAELLGCRRDTLRDRLKKLRNKAGGVLPSVDIDRLKN